MKKLKRQIHNCSVIIGGRRGGSFVFAFLFFVEEAVTSEKNFGGKYIHCRFLKCPFLMYKNLRICIHSLAHRMITSNTYNEI